MKHLLKKILIILAFALNIGLTVFGFATLLDSPYTGVRMSVCGDYACVKSVDKDSPAYGKVQPGDQVVDVNGLNISYFVFNVDPDYVRLQRDHKAFWKSMYMLNETVEKGKRVEFSIKRNDMLSSVAITPVQFPASRALFRTAPVYIAGLTFLFVAYLIYRKKVNEISVSFMILAFFACLDFVAANPYAVRDVAFPSLIFRIASFIDFLATLAGSFSLFHFMLVFPTKKRILNKRAWVIKVLYAPVLLLAVLHLTDSVDNTQLLTYLPVTISFGCALCMLVISFFREKDTVMKRQIKWVIFGTTTALSIYEGLTAIPLMIRAPIISAEITVLPMILIPLTFAFAITKYKLMEIDTIVDTAVVYGFTILVLAGVETIFLSFASPYLLSAGKGLPAFSIVAVLLIVFIYVPIRNFVKGIVERLFKRGKYDPEKELQQFTVSLGLCDERSALEKFGAFVNNLLKPSGIIVLKVEDKRDSILLASNDFARTEGESLATHAAEVWRHVRSKGTCAFGYELSEKIAQGGAPLTPDLESALFVPFITDPENKTSGYLAVLLKKWNETAYSVKDVTLLNAISVNIANIIEAGELRKERDAIEERFRKEKDAVMKELHDGLGNILTGITVTTQAAERMLEGARDKAGELVGRIGSFSTEAMDFLRTGLTVLDNPHGDIGSLMETINDRFGDMFESAGMDLRIECTEEAKRVRPGALVAMNLTRIIQEALTNIIKHAGAQRANIEVTRTKEGVALAVSDDGKGFNPGEKKHGHGLTNMQRRVEELAGVMEVTCSRESGTKILSTIPLTDGAGNEEGLYAAGNR